MNFLNPHPPFPSHIGRESFIIITPPRRGYTADAVAKVSSFGSRVDLLLLLSFCDPQMLIARGRRRLQPLNHQKWHPSFLCFLLCTVPILVGATWLPVEEEEGKNREETLYIAA